MQNLEIISINLWNILISLFNLLILFWILKRFLYKPVKKVLSERQNAIDEKYSAAKSAEDSANMKKQQWEQKMLSAKDEADNIIASATQKAELKSRAIIDEGYDTAQRIRQRAEEDIVLERKKAEAEIKKGIVDISSVLSEKMLGREINENDHRELINQFLTEMGDDNDGDK